MAKSAPTTIILKAEQHMVQNEAVAGGAITPGHLVALNTSGQVVVHPTAGGTSPEKAFAIENDARGHGITDAYASGDRVRYAVCPPGVEVYAILTTSQTITVGDVLESAGNGTLRERVAQTSVGATSPAVAVRDPAIATAIEAVTTTGSTARIKVRVL